MYSVYCQHILHRQVVAAIHLHIYIHTISTCFGTHGGAPLLPFDNPLKETKFMDLLGLLQLFHSGLKHNWLHPWLPHTSEFIMAVARTSRPAAPPLPLHGCGQLVSSL